jgi:hypothetical protein
MNDFNTQNFIQENINDHLEKELKETFSSLLKQKREKLRTEIRKSDLSSSLKEKRNLYSKFGFESQNETSKLVRK